MPSLSRKRNITEVESDSESNSDVNSDNEMPSLERVLTQNTEHSDGPNVEFGPQIQSLDDDLPDLTSEGPADSE
jgi:hypothetical protein